MKKHYDIALSGIWWGSNYGSCLNGYAVYNVLKSMGLSVLLINKHNATANDWEITDTHNARFMRKFYPADEVSPVIPFNRLHELNNICDAFLTGSDQIWNYNINSKFDMAFLLNFVEDSKRKISFATSFGHGYDKTPKDKLQQSIDLFHRYNAISVREQNGVDICKNVFGVKASVVLEPVFCLESDEYYKLAEQSELSGYAEKNEPYILTYILDPTPEKRRAIQYYSKISGMKAINILDGNPGNYNVHKQALDLPNTMGKIGAEDMMKLYKGCSFVISDSFHGTAFAIIFGKPFISITNFGRGAVRFGELLGKFGLTDRLVPNPREIPEDPKFFEPVDFTHANEVMASERARSIEWLKNAIETPLDKMPTILVPNAAVTTKLDKNMCTGCGACVSVCPVDALSLKPDDIGYYRSTIDYDRCINCGLCSKTCPALELPQNNNTKEPTCYEFIAADKNVLYRSSSGGIFPTLAHEVFRRNGAVAGVAWKDDFSAEHIIIDNEADLPKLQKSKYFQSYVGDIYRRIKEKLDNGVFVLFSGCPCQVTGLKAYLKKDYDNLLLVDILCGNAPSSMFFQKYIQDSFPNGLKEYQFRYKSESYKWDPITVKVTESNGDFEIRRGGTEDNYQRVYHNHTMCSKHCENCRYQAVPRFGDLSIGDFWGIGGKDNTISTDQGVSVILCNNEKGRRFLESIPAEEIAVMKQVPLKWLGKNGWAINDSHNFVSPNRDKFYNAIKTMPFSKAVDYALKPNHGNYQNIPTGNALPLLQFNTNFLHFRFESEAWEEHTIDGSTVLIVKSGQAKPGKFARMPLFGPLEKGKTYTLSIRFKVKTNSDYVNFHIKDSGSNYFQVIHYYKVPKNSDEEWVELTKTFIPNSALYDEFMIGASQIIGSGSYIAFDYIYITKNY